MRKPSLTSKVMRGLLILQEGRIQGAWAADEDVRMHGYSLDDERDAVSASAWINQMKVWRERRAGVLRVDGSFEAPMPETTSPEGCK